ncbi:hypothetical protein PYW07_006628 [Mythimna separata]|uniref:Uncharacterized protein n=1 Tax=Mythimna separata TaxID=271217 RepID=A0AAD7YWM8_MYTSE|nr:hypothetical protein PYW07_006628 [Mythimna separata]
MSVSSFDEMNNILRSKIKREDTIMRRSIQAEERLAVTLRVPYLAQARAECAISRDASESAVKARIFDDISRKYAIPENSFRRSERIEFIAPKEGPLADHLTLLAKSGLSSRVGAFYESVLHNPFTEIMLELADAIVNNPIDYGILPSIELGTQVADRSTPTLERYARNNLPYTNIGIFENEELDPAMARAPRTQLSLQHVTQMFATFNVQHSIRNYSARGVVVLNIPIPFIINTNSIIPECDGEILQVTYDSKRVDNNPRKNLTWRACNINLTEFHLGAFECEKISFARHAVIALRG